MTREMQSDKFAKLALHKIVEATSIRDPSQGPLKSRYFQEAIKRLQTADRIARGKHAGMDVYDQENDGK